MKKFFAVAAGLCIFLAVNHPGYCAKESDPGEVVAKYLDASIASRYAEVYGCLSEENKEGQTLEEYVNKMAEKEKKNVSEKIFVSKVTYEIKEEKIDGSHAEVKVAVTMPNLGQLIAATIAETLARSIKESVEGKKTLQDPAKIAKDNAIIKEAMQKSMDKDVSMMTVDQTFILVKEAGLWKVAAEQKKEKKQE